MAAGNFEKCLNKTLVWEGGYSNHPDDPGGPTMRGVIQREYDKWRTAQGLKKQPVRNISDAELKAIYRQNYWDAMGCDSLDAGLDLCVFDAAVNSGPARAQAWYSASPDIDCFCAERLAFLQKTGRLWRVFGRGWRARVAGIRMEAHRMAGTPDVVMPADDDTLHAGMRGDAVRTLQTKLRALGYPAGAVDGIFGDQTYRAVVLFQHDHELQGEPGVWQPAYDDVLKDAEPMLPKRKEVNHKDLEQAGDKPVAHMNLIQRLLAWIFGASAVGQVVDGNSVVGSMTALQTMLEPVRGLLEWAGGHKWLMLAMACAGGIALVRMLRSQHVEAFQNFDYQGAQPTEKGA